MTVNIDIVDGTCNNCKKECLILKEMNICMDCFADKMENGDFS